MAAKLYQNGYLEVGDNHKIYYECYGDPANEPVLFIHGGPGGHMNSKYLIGIDTEKCFAVMYDQRGCGKSLPMGEIDHNTTSDLINDIDLLLKHLNLKKTSIYAGSWGACLALLYAEARPHIVKHMFLNCSFLARKEDKKFLYDNIKTIFPDYHSQFIDKIPPQYQNDPPSYLYNEIIKGNLERRKEIACLMANYEYSLMNLTYNQSSALDPENMSPEDIIPTKIFLHYETNDFFIEDNQIINNADKIKKIPIVFVHGRFDMDAPLSGVWHLHKKLPLSDLTIVPYEGHSGEMKKTLLVKALNKYLANKKSS